jgi:hypothetical protein
MNLIEEIQNYKRVILESSVPRPLAGKTPEELISIGKEYGIRLPLRDAKIIIKFLNGPQDENTVDHYYNKYDYEMAELSSLETRMKYPKDFTDPKEKQVFRVISDLTISKVGPADVDELEFYLFSPVRLVVQDISSHNPEAWFMNGKDNLKSTGFTNVKEFADWLVKHGVRQVKKPKTRKYTPSYYD